MAKLCNAALLRCLWLPRFACRAQPAAHPPPHPSAAHEVHVLAAADLQPVLPALADQFEHATGIKLVISYGSSATLATQVMNGAPADLFLSADYSFPEQVVAAKLADTPAPVAYARGTLVLWARKDSPFQPLSQSTLSDGKYTSLAIANPDHAPYGRAAVSALTWMKLYETLKPKIVQAENIAQTAQFVQSGNAQLGLISLTSASTPEMMQASAAFHPHPATDLPGDPAVRCGNAEVHASHGGAPVPGLAEVAGDPDDAAEVWARSGAVDSAR